MCSPRHDVKEMSLRVMKTLCRHPGEATEGEEMTWLVWRLLHKQKDLHLSLTTMEKGRNKYYETYTLGSDDWSQVTYNLITA